MALTDDDAVDPLMEQMRSVLNLVPRMNDQSRRRERRFSDTDRPTSAMPSVRPESIAVRSKDGSRWLPAPDEQSHRVGLGSSDIDQPVAAQLWQPLERHTCPNSVCSMRRVLDTTELLEIVLGFLETKDVLSLRRTSKHWHSVVEQSPQLRLHFFTYGQWNRPGSQFKPLPLSVAGMVIERGPEVHLGSWIKVSFTYEAARRIVPEPKPSRRIRSRSIFEGLRGGLGSRAQKSDDAWPESKATQTVHSTLQYEDLLVCQPPLSSMQAFIILPNAAGDEDGGVENSEGLNGPPACAKLSCDAGITLGFLAETAQSLLASQTSGPSSVGEARVLFKAIMSFVEPDQAPRKRNNTRGVTRI